MSEREDLVRWINSKYRPRWQPHLSATQNAYVRDVGIKCAKEVAGILTKYGPLVPAKPKQKPLDGERAKLVEGSNLHKMLLAYKGAFDLDEPYGLTSYEASLKSGVMTNYWKRNSDLVRNGWIEDTGELKVSSKTGKKQKVYCITELGIEKLEEGVVKIE